MVRLTLVLKEKSEWLRLFDSRGFGLFVPNASPPDIGDRVRVDLTITEGGPRVILKGAVLWRRAEQDARGAPGCHVGLSREDREKVNFLNGFVRGGLLNRREKRRLPLRLKVTFGGVNGPEETYCRDINEEGIFVLTEKPLAEGTTVHMMVRFPGREAPVDLRGEVSHTVVVEDEDVPGMGIRFIMDATQSRWLMARIDELEEAFYKGSLPEDVIA